jgi:hypothetical protein
MHVCPQVAAQRQELEDKQAAAARLQVQLERLAAAELEAREEAAAVQQAVLAAVAELGQEAQPAAGPAGDSPAGADARHDAAAHVSALVQRIRNLERQLADQQERQQEAAQGAAENAEAQRCGGTQAAGVQCEAAAVCHSGVQAAAVEAAVCHTGSQTAAAETAVCHSGVQAGASEAAVPPAEATEDSSTQTEREPGDEACSAPAATAAPAYGRPDQLQQQVAQLTAELAAARLAQVGGKAEAAALRSQLHSAQQEVGDCWFPQQCKVDGWRDLGFGQGSLKSFVLLCVPGGLRDCRYKG